MNYILPYMAGWSGSVPNEQDHIILDPAVVEAVAKELDKKRFIHAVKALVDHMNARSRNVPLAKAIMEHYVTRRSHGAEYGSSVCEVSVDEWRSDVTEFLQCQLNITLQKLQQEYGEEALRTATDKVLCADSIEAVPRRCLGY